MDRSGHAMVTKLLSEEKLILVPPSTPLTVVPDKMGSAPAAVQDKDTIAPDAVRAQADHAILIIHFPDHNDSKVIEIKTTCNDTKKQKTARRPQTPNAKGRA